MYIKTSALPRRSIPQTQDPHILTQVLPVVHQLPRAALHQRRCVQGPRLVGDVLSIICPGLVVAWEGEGRGCVRGRSIASHRSVPFAANPLQPRSTHQVQLDIFQIFALGQVVVVGSGEQAQLVPSDDALCKG